MSIHLSNVTVAKDDLSLNVTMPDGTIESYDLRKTLHINEFNLQDEFVKQPALFAFLASLMEAAQDRLATANLALERHQAILTTQVRSGKLIPFNHSPKATDKLTEGALKAYITSDKKTQVLQDDVTFCEAQCGRLRVWVKGADQRREMLIQLGLLARQQYRNDGVQVKQ